MNYHPDKKQLMDFAAESLKKKDYEAVAEHISKCDECSSMVNSFSIILKSSDNSAMVPPQGVKNRVLGLARESENNKEAAMSFRSALRSLMRPPVFASVILIAILSIFIYTMQKSSVVQGDIMLILSLNNGSVLHNESLLQKKDVDINSGVIKTKEYSSAVLRLESVLSVKIAENSELSIVNANKKIEKEITEYNIALEMRSGSIFASSDHNIKKKFFISTKQAGFEALGTSFIITSDNLSSKLSVLDGSVRATSKADGRSILLGKGEGCIVNSSLQKMTVNTENELKRFNALFNKTKDAGLQGKEKIMSSEKVDAKSNLVEDSGKENADKDKNATSQDKEKTGDLRQNKTELRDESRQIQKEMRNNLRSGKRSQR